MTSDRGSSGRTSPEGGSGACSRADQWEHIRALLYADLTDILLLTIDSSKLTSPRQLDPVEDD